MKFCLCAVCEQWQCKTIKIMTIDSLTRNGLICIDYLKHTVVQTVREQQQRAVCKQLRGRTLFMQSVC